MHPIRRQRLILVLLVLTVAGAGAALIGYGLRGNINLFYPPSAIAAGKAPVGVSLRAGGMVREGSVVRATDSLEIRFTVTDYSADVPVIYEGIIPDLFAEGEGVVVTGILGEDGVVRATEVLAKHDEKYMPPEVSEALRQAEEASDDS